MGKNKKNKKKEPAPETRKKETGNKNTETEETEQMTQEEERMEEAEQPEKEETETSDGTETRPEETADTETAAEEMQEETAEENIPGEEGGPDEDARGFFKKKKDESKKDEILADLTDKLQRQMAEFENFRRRTEKEKSTMYDMGTRDTVEKLLPVIDNFERGLAGADENDPFAEGMKMIYKQLMTMLTDLGVTPIDAEGKEFDPNLHNAVMHVDDDSFGDNIVAEELLKGYMFKDHVVRHSMVKVAN